MPTREPRLRPIPVRDLRPTQMTVGYREVMQKRRQWREQAEAAAGKFLGEHMIPVLLGPKERRYVIDHHHLARALIEEGVSDVLTTVVADLRHLKRDEFWTYVDNKAWCHPYDDTGVRRPFSDIPNRIADLADDPFRSLAGELRRAGGYAKDTAPFAEFIWADFLRRRIKNRAVVDSFETALARALVLAKSDDAVHLPGWCGPHA